MRGSGRADMVVLIFQRIFAMMTHYQTRYDLWDSCWVVQRDGEDVAGLRFADEDQARCVLAALEDAVALGEAKSKAAIRETAELFFNRP